LKKKWGVTVDGVQCSKVVALPVAAIIYLNSLEWQFDRSSSYDWNCEGNKPIATREYHPVTETGPLKKKVIVKKNQFTINYIPHCVDAWKILKLNV
jgi:hypothetical protein